MMMVEKKPMVYVAIVEDRNIMANDQVRGSKKDLMNFSLVILSGMASARSASIRSRIICKFHEYKLAKVFPSREGKYYLALLVVEETGLVGEVGDEKPGEETEDNSEDALDDEDPLPAVEVTLTLQEGDGIRLRQIGVSDQLGMDDEQYTPRIELKPAMTIEDR